MQPVAALLGPWLMQPVAASLPSSSMWVAKLSSAWTVARLEPWLMQPMLAASTKCDDAWPP